MVAAALLAAATVYGLLGFGLWVVFAPAAPALTALGLLLFGCRGLTAAMLLAAAVATRLAVAVSGNTGLCPD